MRLYVTESMFNMNRATHAHLMESDKAWVTNLIKYGLQMIAMLCCQMALLAMLPDDIVMLLSSCKYMHTFLHILFCRFINHIKKILTF